MVLDCMSGDARHRIFSGWEVRMRIIIVSFQHYENTLIKAICTEVPVNLRVDHLSNAGNERGIIE